MEEFPAPPNPHSIPDKTPASLGQMIFGHAVLFLLCVVLPGIMTAAAPVGRVQFTRADGTVTAQVTKCLLFFVPYSRTTVSDVRSIGGYTSSGSLNRSRAPGGSLSTTHSESSAHLTIEGASGTATVEVSLVNAKMVNERARMFLDDPNRTSLSLTVVANWKFGVVAGGLLSFLTVFYVYLQVGSLIRWMVRRG